MLAFLRLICALIGWLFGFFLGVSLLEVSRVTELSNRLIVVILLAAACAILGWLGAEYVTILPARWLIRRIRELSAADLLAGSFGGLVGLVLASFLAVPLSALPDSFGRFAPLVVAAFLGMTGAAAGAIKGEELIALLRDLRGGRDRQRAERVLLDTSVIIDGRIADIAQTGFLRGSLVVPRFILLELQAIASSSDPLRRARGRRGLDMLARLQKEAILPVEVIERDAPQFPAEDTKLVAVAKELRSPILTNDYGLNRVAELEGVAVMNVNELATAVRPLVLPGEELSVKVVQEGKESGQGVGYLDDGTMVVIEGGGRHMGEELGVIVLRVLQTVAGRMVFAQPKGETVEAARRSRGFR
jgi:uncharacterized protein YacL